MTRLNVVVTPASGGEMTRCLPGAPSPRRPVPYGRARAPPRGPPERQRAKPASEAEHRPEPTAAPRASHSSLRRFELRKRNRLAGRGWTTGCTHTMPAVFEGLHWVRWNARAAEQDQEIMWVGNPM